MTDTNFPEEVEHAMNILYRAGPAETDITRALARLRTELGSQGGATLWFDRIPWTAIGPVFVAANARGVVAIDFGVNESQFITNIQREHGSIPTRAPEKLAAYTARIANYLQGIETTLDIPFDIDHLTPFQQQVLLAALQIPRGQVLTYGQVAQKIGNPGAVRAVGTALGRNPVPIVIPCHRVIASGGGLGGYSGGGGVETKRKLLIMEGALIG